MSRPRIVPPGPGAWPEVTHGGDFEPYVDHEVDSDGTLDPGVVGEKTPIAWGTVQAIPWSLTAFLDDGRGGSPEHRSEDGSPGPAGQLFLGTDGEFGGGGLSLYNTIPWRPRDLGLSTQAFGSGPLTVHLGVVSPRVAAVGFTFEDGTEISRPPIPGPVGVDAGYFILWAPNDVGGTIRALDDGGGVLAEHRLHLLAIGIDPRSNGGAAYG